MKLYDRIIEDTLQTLSGLTPAIYAYDEKKAWKDTGESSFIMQREAALEIGGGGVVSVNYTCVTTGDEVTKDDILVYGPDLKDLLNGTPVSFARIVLLQTEDLGEDRDTEKAFEAIRNLEFVRYHVYPEGYMVRVSAQSDQEQIRLSREALKKGISFEQVGNLYIRKYKEIPLVKHVRILFVTGQETVEKLMPNASKVTAITRTLTHILDGMPTDCGHCSMKPVCDEVDGMRELHLGKK